MRDDRETQFCAIWPRGPALFVVRGSAGIGKTDLVRRWAAELPGTALLWPHVAPPRNAENFWMRVITQLHARGWIDDHDLYEIIARAGRPDENVRDLTGEVLRGISEAPLIVIDDLHSTVDDDIYLEVVNDLAHFLRACDRLRAVIIESSASPLDRVDLPEHLVIDEAQVPPVAFLGSVDAAPARYLSSAPGLRALVQDPRLLREVCLAALPAELDAEAARAATDREGDELIETFARWGLGALRAGPHGLRFVFRADVRAEALVELRHLWPGAMAAASARLASLYLSRGEVTTAFEYAVLTEDTTIISRMGLRMAPFPFEFTPEALEAIVRLPLDTVRESPLVSLLAATVAEHMPRPDHSASELYRHAAESARATMRGGPPTERLLMLGLESYARRQAGETSAAVATGLRFRERALAMIEKQLIDPELAHAFGSFAYQVAVVLVSGDEFAPAASLLRGLERFCLAHGIDYRRRFALAGLAFLESLAGLVPSADALTQAARGPLPATLQRSRSYTAFLDSSAAIRAVLAGDFPALRRAVSRFRTRPHEMHWDILLFGEVVLDLAAGNAATARARFDNAVGASRAHTTGATTARRASYVRALLVLFGENPRLLASAGTRTAEDPLSLAFSAGRDIDHGELENAAGKLGKGAASANTPLQEHLVFTMLARLGVARQDPEIIRDAASRLLLLAGTHRLKIGFALLTTPERARILEALGSPAELRAAFALTRPLVSEAATPNTSALTSRQLVVIRALADLGTRQAVARELYLSPGTVKAHLRAIYKKLDAHNQAEALSKAAALGLLQSP